MDINDFKEMLEAGRDTFYSKEKKYKISNEDEKAAYAILKDLYFIISQCEELPSDFARGVTYAIDGVLVELRRAKITSAIEHEIDLAAKKLATNVIFQP